MVLRGWLLSSGVRVALAALLFAAPALGQEQQAGQLLFSYPSAETLVVPRNAQFIALGAYDAGPPVLVLDGAYDLLEKVGETGAHRLRVAPAEPFTPGPHRLVIGAGRDDVEFAFEVEDAFGPDSDDVASVRVTRAVRFVAVESYALLEAYYRETEALMADPADCSRLVVQQLFPQDDQTPGRAGAYRLELEAEGPVLGFIVDGSIVLPGHCRGAFLPSLGKHPGAQPGSGYLPGFEAGFETEPLLVQVVTATGVGTTQEYAGNIEDYIPALDDAAPAGDPYSEKASRCSVGSAGSEHSYGKGLSLILLSGIGFARRWPRWLRAARP